LLHEVGCEVELIVRDPIVRWLHKRPWLHTFTPIARLLYAPPDVGQAGISHLVARPTLFRCLPRALQDHLGKRATRPAGAPWLRPRLTNIGITTGRTVLAARESGSQVCLTLNDRTERRVDHVLLATGYPVDIAKYRFLAGELRRIRRVDGYPVLNEGFESSLAGLHFVGAASAWSFGPLMRFVAGTRFASRSLQRAILRTSDVKNAVAGGTTTSWQGSQTALRT
jgi:hypothetical protein